MTATVSIHSTARIVSLADFIASNGRLGAAKILGCTGPALANALKAGRTIFVELAENGTATAVEVSPFPSRKARFPRQSAVVGFVSEILRVFQNYCLYEQSGPGDELKFDNDASASNAGPVQRLPTIGVCRFDEHPND